MASKDFVVKNGLQVSNGNLSVNGSLVVSNAINVSGSNGTAGQILTSNGNSNAYWSTPATFSVNTAAQYTWTNTHTFSNTVFFNAVSANGSLGTAGQVLTSNGSDTYWSNVSGGGGTSINLSANTTDTATYYFPMSNASSGTWSNGVVSNTSLYFVPATGTLSAAIFNSLSDLEFKTDVKRINNSVDVLKKINGVSFKWKETGHKSYGVVAQEVEKVLPEIVDINNDVKSVNYQALIGFLIEAVKELSDRIEKLENGQ